jgi:hypothetical protein
LFFGIGPRFYSTINTEDFTIFAVSLNKNPFIFEDKLNDYHLVLCFILNNPNGKVRPPPLVDSGGIGIVFMNESYAREYSFFVYPFSNLRTLTVIDGRPIAGDILTHYIWIFMKIGDHIEQLPMLFISLGHYPVILGVKWARLHGVKLDMHRNKIRFDFEYCFKNCLPNKTPLTVVWLPINDFDSDSGYESDPNPEFPSPISTGGSFVSPVRRECAAFVTTFLTRRLSQRAYLITFTGRHLTNTSAASYIRKVQEIRLFIPIFNI